MVSEIAGTRAAIMIKMENAAQTTKENISIQRLMAGRVDTCSAKGLDSIALLDMSFAAMKSIVVKGPSFIPTALIFVSCA